jgi:glucose-6-phosphate isomerase
MFDEDPNRGERLAAEAVGLYLDYSKNRILVETLALLLRLAEESDLRGRIDSMFRGDKINVTQGTPALHTALRTPWPGPTIVDGQDAVRGFYVVLDRMSDFCNRIRSDAWKGHTGKRIRNIVNVGTWGSDLAPMMAYEGLKHYSDRTRTFRFLANVDATDFAEAVRDLDPAETLFIISSKSFTTSDEMTNAYTLRAWLLAGLGHDENAIRKHFVAVSMNADAVQEFGIDPAYMFEPSDWVSERYSLMSAAGLSTMLAIGPRNFRAMLDGCNQMDEHFSTAPFDRNLPVLMALLSIWYNNFFGAPAVAVLPYEQYLKWFPAYLQHVAMESNGKQATIDGYRVTWDTSPLYFGEPGTNVQHSFFQLLHQGTRLIPCDFIGFAKPLNPMGRHHDVLLANMFAQTEALAFGNSAARRLKLNDGQDWLLSHRVFDGNRPSNTILAEQLTPETLGKLVALYEHCVFTQGVIWQIDSFDQWGLELGDVLARHMVTELISEVPIKLGHDSSTNSLIRRYRKLKES